MENCTQVLDDSIFLNYDTPDIGRLKVGSLLIQGVSHDIFRGDNIIGRDELSDIVIRSGAISSKHAVIEVEDWDTHLVYDCGSTNKTRLAKAVLKPNVRYNLQGDDDLMFADLKAKYTKLEKPQDPNVDDDGSETGSESMLNCDSVNQPLDLDGNDPEPGPSSHLEKLQDLNDDDSGSETGSESMLYCDSINQGLDLDANDSGPGPSSRRALGDEESGNIFNSVLEDSSVLDHKNKDIEESRNQVIDASGDETEDDEFFVLPSQTVKEFRSNRQDKSNKMANLSLTEDIFDPSVVAKHCENKDSCKSKLEINSSKDIFEAETQDDDFDTVFKPIGVSKNINVMDVDSQCVFNTEAHLTVKRDRNNQDDTSIFEAETQEMDLGQVPVQNAKQSCDIDIFDAESELADCQSLHNQNKKFEKSKEEDKLNDTNKSVTDNVNSSNALEEDEISDLALSAVLSQVNSSLESMKSSKSLKDVTKERTQPNTHNKDQENGSESIIADKKQKCNHNTLERTKIKATVKTNRNTSLVNTEKSIRRNEHNSGTSKDDLSQDGLKIAENRISISETCSSNGAMEDALTQINTKLVEIKESGCDTYQENKSLESANKSNLTFDKSVDPPILNINEGNQKAINQTEKSTNSICSAADSDKKPLLNSTTASSEDPNVKPIPNNIKSEFEIKKEIFADINSDEDDNFAHEATQVNLNICDVKEKNTRIFELYDKVCKKEQNIEAEETQLNLNLYNLFAETEVNEGNLKNEINICEAETQPNLQIETPSLDENDSTDVEDGMEMNKSANLVEKELNKNRTNCEFDICEAETQPNLQIPIPKLDENESDSTDVENEIEMNKSTKSIEHELKRKRTKHEFDICEAETQPNLLLEKSNLDRNESTNVEDKMFCEAETQPNLLIDNLSLDKIGTTNVEDGVGFEAETQLNLQREKLDLDRNESTNVEDRMFCEAETQPNLLIEKPSLDKIGTTNVEDGVGFEAETQPNLQQEKPGLDRNESTNVEDRMFCEAETQPNLLIEKPSLDKIGSTNLDDGVCFEAETQPNLQLEKPNLDKNGRTIVKDGLDFEAETQPNLLIEKPSLDKNGKTIVEDGVDFEAETQVNLQIMKPKLCDNESIDAEDGICEAETQPNLRLWNPRLDKNNRLDVEDEVKMNKSTKLTEQELNEKCISVADMEICSTVGQNVHISAMSACKSTKKKLFNDKPCDSLNQSILFNEPCSSSTPFKPFHNVISTQVTKKNILHTPKRMSMNEVLCVSPVLPSTEELIAVADKTPERAHKSNLDSQRSKNDNVPLIVNRTPRAKKMSRKMAEHLNQVKEEETNCDEQSSAVIQKVSKNQKDSGENKSGYKKGVVVKLNKELRKTDSLEKNNSNELAENPDDCPKVNLKRSYVKIEKYFNEPYQKSPEKKQNSKTLKSSPKINPRSPTKEKSIKISLSKIDDSPPLNQNEKQIKKSKRIAQIATDENQPNPSKKENKTKTKDVTLANTNHSLNQDVTCKNAAEENVLNKESEKIIIEKSERKTNGSMANENEVRSQLEDNKSHKDLCKLSGPSPRKSSRSKRGNLADSELHKNLLKDQLSSKEVKVSENKRNVESDTSEEKSTHPLFQNEKQLKKSKRIAKISINEILPDQSKKGNKSKPENVPNTVPKTNGIKQDVTYKNTVEGNILNNDCVELITNKSERNTNIKESKSKPQLEDNESHTEFYKISEPIPRKSNRSKKRNLADSELQKDLLNENVSLKDVSKSLNQRKLVRDESEETSNVKSSKSFSHVKDGINGKTNLGYKLNKTRGEPDLTDIGLDSNSKRTRVKPARFRDANVESDSSIENEGSRRKRGNKESNILEERKIDVKSSVEDCTKSDSPTRNETFESRRQKRKLVSESLELATSGKRTKRSTVKSSSINDSNQSDPSRSISPKNSVSRKTTRKGMSVCNESSSLVEASKRYRSVTTSQNDDVCMESESATIGKHEKSKTKVQKRKGTFGSLECMTSEDETKNTTNTNDSSFAVPSRTSFPKKAKQSESAKDHGSPDKARSTSRTRKTSDKVDSTRSSRSGSVSSETSTSIQSMSESPRRSVKRGEQVLFTGFSNAAYEANIKKLGGAVVDSPDSCTVLVTDKVRRTVKFLCVLAQGKPIVDPEWIEQSWRCTCFKDPMNHLLLDLEAQSRFSFDLRLTINEAKKQPMLTGYTVHATPSVKPPPDDIKSIVESCGGKFLPKVPSKWPDQTIVISHPDDKSLWKKLKVRGSTPPIVAAEFLLLGVLQYRIDILTHKIS